MYTNAQELALRIANTPSEKLSLKHKNELLSYIVEYADTLDSSESNFNLYLFTLYINSLQLPFPDKDTTAILVSTHFNLNLNKNLTSLLKKKVVFDIFPKREPEEWFNKEYISNIIAAITQINKNNLEYKLRICDAHSSLGEVVWFDPYLKGKNMSVKWDYDAYTVRDFELTCKMCEMAKRAWKDYAYSI